MSAEKTQIALIKKSDLTLCDTNFLTENQLQFILRPTPIKFVKERPAKGGGTWKFVSGGYIRKVLNIMFGWDWDFEILEQLTVHGEAVVKGRLTIRTKEKTIVKTQFGNKEIMYKTEKVFNADGTPKMIVKNGRNVQETRPSDMPLSIGNDLKAAATDALKKCAAELGIAQDVYNASEFKEVIIEETVFKDVALMLNNCNDADEVDAVYFMLNEDEQAKYKPLIDRLKLSFKQTQE